MILVTCDGRRNKCEEYSVTVVDHSCGEREREEANYFEIANRFGED